MASEIELYRRIVSLKGRLEINAENGVRFSKKQLEDSVSLVNQINVILDRRNKGGAK